MIAPSGYRDKHEFAHPAKRLRFYLKQLALKFTAKIPTQAIWIVSAGPQDGDPSFVANLQKALSKTGAPRVHQVVVTNQQMKNCLLLQVADLIHGMRKIYVSLEHKTR